MFDNKIVLYDLSKGRSISLVFVPGKKLQSYAYDFATQLLYVGNGGQSVYVIDMRAEEISVVNKISTLLNGPIKSLLYIESNNVLVAFGSQDGAFKVLHCSNFRDPKAKISMFLHFETGLKDTRKAFYWRERKELWTADNFGYVQVLTGVDLHKPLINTSLAIAAPQGTSGSDTPTPKPKRTTAEIRIPVGTRYIFRVHYSGVTKLGKVSEDTKAHFFTSAKDGSFKFWTAPEFWENPEKGRATEVSKFEHPSELLEE